MSADRLIPASIATAVRQVLAGAQVPAVAATAGLDPADLADAVDTYHAAGLAALHERADNRWYDVRVQFADWTGAERIAADSLAPRLDRLRDDGAISGWWFLRKYPRWRLRFADPDIATIDQVLDDFAANANARWWATIYEPETYAFGGPVSMRVAHDLFCADSLGVLEYLRQPQPALGRRELSLLLIGALLDAAEQDWFERGDVFAKIAEMRPAAAIGRSRLDALIGNVRGLLTVGRDPDGSLFGPGGAASFAAPWHGAYTPAGRELAAAAGSGMLIRGLRQIASQIVIFHWNRLGLTATTQADLARAAVEVFLPRS